MPAGWARFGRQKRYHFFPDDTEGMPCLCGRHRFTRYTENPSPFRIYGEGPPLYASPEAIGENDRHGICRGCLAGHRDWHVARANEADVNAAIDGLRETMAEMHLSDLEPTVYEPVVPEPYPQPPPMMSYPWIDAGLEHVQKMERRRDAMVQVRQLVKDVPEGHTHVWEPVMAPRFSYVCDFCKTSDLHLTTLSREWAQFWCPQCRTVSSTRIGPVRTAEEDRTIRHGDQEFHVHTELEDEDDAPEPEKTRWDYLEFR